MLRIGQGFDLHRTKVGRRLVIGGVEIPSAFGLDGHSDADVLLHAVTDAFLGALALGDIGQWFPDKDPKYLGADSAELLKTVLRDKAFQGWHLVNLDCTLFAEAPKFSPWSVKVRQSLADIIGCDVSQVSVKAKTNEKQDAIGRGEAIAASAILLLERGSDATC